MKNIKVKRFLALALLAVSLLVVAMPAHAAYSTMYVANIASNETVYLRATPSTNAVWYAKIGYGKAVQAEYHNSSWHKVQYNGITGYVMSQFLSYAQPGAIGGGLQVGAEAYTTGTHVYLRSGAGTDYSIVGQTNLVSEKVFVYASSQPVSGYIWYNVQHYASGVVGWIRGDYLEQR